MVQFRYSQTLPDTQMLNDFNNLAALNEEQLGQLIDIVILFFQGLVAQDLMARVADFSQAHSINPNALRNIIRYY